MIKLYKHQQRFLDKTPAKSLLCWDTGTGKTLTALEWSKKRIEWNLKNWDVLVICPKSLKENWRREVAKFLQDNRGGQTPTFTIFSKEEFRKDWETLNSYNTIIVDEAHYFAGIKSQMSKNLFKYLQKHDVGNILLLSATPYMSTPWNIYTLARHLGYKWNYPIFSFKYFENQYVGRGRRMVPMVKPGIEKDMAKLVKEIGDIVRLDECVDVPDQVFVNEHFTLLEIQKKEMKEIQEVNPIVRFTRYHQIENGTLKSDGFTENKFIDTEKNDRILDLAKEHDKIAVICRYNLQIDALYALLRAKQDKEVLIIRGNVKDRDAVIRQVELLPKAIILIQADCSEGYELPSIGTIVFASLSFSYKNYKQIIGRFLRINKIKKNVYIHLITQGGVDEAVFESIMNKQNFDIEIYSRDL